MKDSERFRERTGRKNGETDGDAESDWQRLDCRRGESCPLLDADSSLAHKEWRRE